MTDARIIQLIARKLSGEATTDDRAELDQLLTRDPEAVYYAELITQLWDEEKIREISSREVTDRDMAYLKHLARHRPTFDSPAAPRRPSLPAIPLKSASSASASTTPQRAVTATPPAPQKKRTFRQRAWILLLLIFTAAKSVMTRIGAERIKKS